MGQPVVVSESDPSEPKGEASVHPTFCVHDLVRVDRVRGDRDLGYSRRCLQAGRHHAERFRGSITRSPRTWRTVGIASLVQRMQGGIAG